MGWFSKIFPNLSQFWLKFKKILEKLGDFAQNLAQNWADWYINESLFLEKLLLGLLSNFKVARPYQNQTWVSVPLGNLRRSEAAIGGEKWIDRTKLIKNMDHSEGTHNKILWFHDTQMGRIPEPTDTRYNVQKVRVV